MNEPYDYFRDYLGSFLTDNEPNSSEPIGECRYNCGNAEHVGGHKYMCLHQDHWDQEAA